MTFENVVANELKDLVWVLKDVLNFNRFSSVESIKLGQLKVTISLFP